MNALPYCPLPGHHPARAYTKAEHMKPGYLAEQFSKWRQEHTADDLVPKHAPHTVGDDFDHVERHSYLEQPGAFK